MGGSGRRSTGRGSRPPRRAGPGRPDRRACIPPRTGSNRSACLAGYPRPPRPHARDASEAGPPPKRVRLAQPRPGPKAVIVLTILLLIIVLLLLFGGWGYSRRGRRI